MACETAGPVMVLAVYVRGERAADRDLPGARGHRHEPAIGQRGDHQLLQTDARLADDLAARRVDAGDPVQPGRENDEAAVVLRRVVVAPAQPARDGAAAWSRRQQPSDLISLARLGDARP